MRLFSLTVGQEVLEGNGTVGFTLDKELGSFVLTQPEMRIPEDSQEFAINASNARNWEPPVKRYIDELLAGKTGPYPCARQRGERCAGLCSSGFTPAWLLPGTGCNDTTPLATATSTTI